MREVDEDVICRCGHPRGNHMHYANQWDTSCATCGLLVCRGFSPARPVISRGLQTTLLVLVAAALLVVGVSVAVGWSW